jgi:hypothetical protein
MVKVMPSQGHGVTDLMNWTNVEDPEYKSHLDSDLSGALTEYDVSYHLISNYSSFTFPSISISDAMVPVGRSETKCLHVSWAPKVQADHTHDYQPIKNLPKCSWASSGMWSEHDPTNGVDFLVWQQNTTEVSCFGSSCVEACKSAGGWWALQRNQVSGDCYVYEVLDSVCVIVDRVEDAYGNVDWEYAGGCFRDNSPARYHHGEPGKTYTFDSVMVQVRSAVDPYVAAARVTDDDFDFASSTVRLTQSLLYSLAWLFFIAFLVTLGSFVAAVAWLKKNPMLYEEQRDVEQS